MRITREFGFDMGHMLPDHLGGCYRPHGHRYRLEVTLDDDVHTNGPDRGMVLDFADFKRIVNGRIISLLDHRFAVSADDPRIDAMIAVSDDGVVVTANPPTAENLVTLIAETLTDVLPVAEVRLWETPTCSATWVRP